MRVPKPARERDDEYRQWIRAQPCILADREPCECSGYIRVNNRHLASQFCHVKTVGARGGDRQNGYPGCPGHHAEQHRIGIKTFERRYGLNLKQAALDYDERYRQETAWASRD